MAQPGSRIYLWVGVAYAALGLVCAIRNYLGFGFMWLFFGLAALFEYRRGKNQAKWLNVLKWLSIFLGVVMAGVWIFVRR